MRPASSRWGDFAIALAIRASIGAILGVLASCVGYRYILNQFALDRIPWPYFLGWGVGGAVVAIVTLPEHQRPWHRVRLWTKTSPKVNSDIQHVFQISDHDDVRLFFRGSGVAGSFLHLELPEGWREIPGETPRAFRRQEEGSGWLQVSLKPSRGDPETSGESAEARLVKLIDGLEMDIGHRELITHEMTAAGPLAFALHKSSERGMLGFWLLAGGPRTSRGDTMMTFATFVMGNLKGAAQECNEAHAVMKSARWETQTL